jgi:hypothetical protein
VEVDRAHFQERLASDREKFSTGTHGDDIIEEYLTVHGGEW